MIDEFKFLPSLEVGFMESDPTTINEIQNHKIGEIFNIGDDARFPELNIDKLKNYVKFYVKVLEYDNTEATIYRTDMKICTLEDFAANNWI